MSWVCKGQLDYHDSCPSWSLQTSESNKHVSKEINNYSQLDKSTVKIEHSRSLLRGASKH